MKDIKTYLTEQLEKSSLNEAEETIKSLKDFKEWARAKFEKAFGDDFDEDKFKETLDGFIEDNKDLIDAEDWGQLVGKMNEAFAKDKE